VKGPATVGFTDARCCTLGKPQAVARSLLLTYITQVVNKRVLKGLLVKGQAQRQAGPHCPPAPSASPSDYATPRRC